MKRQLVRNLALVAAGAALAIVIGAASAQDAAPQENEPAQLDRSFSDDDGTGGAGSAGRADAGVMMRGGGMGRADAGTSMRDGGTGGAGEAEAAQAEEGDRATRNDHTNIILYGPNGLAEDEPNPNVTSDQGTGGGGGAGAEDGEAAPEGEHTDLNVYGPMGR